jgi:hypothetical protein
MSRSIGHVLWAKVRVRARTQEISSARARHPSSRPFVAEITQIDLLALEIERARRYERAFTLLQVARDALEDASYRLEQVADELSTTIRQGDVLWTDDLGVLVLLPETDPDGATQFVERAAAIVPGLQPARIRRATFPHDGVTQGALFAILERTSVDLPDPHDLPKLGARGPRLLSSAQ